MDLTLSDLFNWPKPDKYTTILGESVPQKQLQKNGFVLKANHFVTASTSESIGVIHHMSAYLGGLSNIGVLGLQIQNTGFIDAGFRGE